MANVFLTLVTDNDDDGENTIYSVVNSTREKAIHMLAEWCRKNWREQGDHEEELSDDDEQAVDRYFQFWVPEQDYDIAERTIDEECP